MTSLCGVVRSLAEEENSAGHGALEKERLGKKSGQSVKGEAQKSESG